MIISKTPLRASFFGGGSDFKAYYETSEIGYGSVLSAALDMHVYITVNKKFDDKIRIVYNGNELVDSVDEVKHNIIREALKIVGIEKGIEVIYMADIPLSTAGVGLASSSALAVGVLNALHTYKHEFVNYEQLAWEACHIEIDCLGQQIGIQDQFAVAHGGFNRYRFLNNGKVSVAPIILDNEVRKKMTNNILLFFTGKTRDSRKILSEQSDNIEKKRPMLDELVRTVDKVYDELLKGNIALAKEYKAETECIGHFAALLKIGEYMNQLKESGRKAFLVPNGGHTPGAVRAYANVVSQTLDELEKQGVRPATIYLPCASGTTHSGVLCAAAKRGIREVVSFAVANTPARAQKGISKLIGAAKEYLPVDFEPGTVTVCDSGKNDYGHPDEELLSLRERLFRTDGILLDPTYNINAFYGMWKALEERPGNEDVLYINTGGYTAY